MNVTKLNPESLAAPLMGLYAQVAIAPPGRLAFLAGQVALDRSGTLVGAGDHGLQAEQCFRNIATSLDALGATSEQIVRMSINVADHRPERIEPIFAAGRRVFGKDWPITASMLLGVQALGLPEWLIEVDAVVWLPAT